MKPILLVDADIKFLEKMRLASDPTTTPVIAVQSGQAAQLVISDKKLRLAGIFVNQNIANPMYLSVIRAGYFHRPSVPIYLILDDNSSQQLSTEEIKKLGLQSSVKKIEIDYLKLVKLVKPIALSFDARKILLEAREKYLHEKEPPAGDENYIPIRSEDFVAGTVSYFDVFVRLNKLKYLKLLHAGDSFDPLRVLNYIQRGVQYLFIRKEMQVNYLTYCDHLATKILNHAKAPLELKAQQVLNTGQETMNFVKAQGLSEQSIQFAKSFVKNIDTLTRQIEKSNKKNFLNEFLGNLASYEHGTGTAFLANILSHKLEIAMDRPIQIVGLACFFHDIGLLKIPEALRDEDESRMLVADREIFRTHTEIGAAMLQELHRDVDPSSIQAVFQHHMRKDSYGFPEKKTNQAINKVAEIIGVCSNLHHLIQKKEQGKKIDVQAEMERRIFPGYSRQTTYACRSAFFPNPESPEAT